jgi:hypothetical protein
MDNEKPQNIDEYREWLSKKHRIDISGRDKTYYSSVTNKIKVDFEKSNFWVKLMENLREYDSEYQLRTGYPLLIPGPKPDLYIKPFDSFLLKTFRKNVLENERWPGEPKDGWILPNNWFCMINDIVRTLFVVKYLDGVEFLIDKIKTCCELHRLSCNCFLEAKEEGYYAAHLYSEQEFVVPSTNWDTERIKVSTEIQITTQLQEVIRRLLHKYYEERRKRIKEENIKWQWNYKSDEFTVNYLGHILHYVEGMIMEVRETQKEEIK